MMARFLFVVPPLTGHVNPTVSVGQRLVDRGHEVAWVAHPSRVATLLPPGARLFPLEEPTDPDLARDTVARAHRARGMASLKLLWEDFLVPLARSTRDGVDAAAEAFAPEVMVVDQQAIAGSLVARLRGSTWATSVTTSASVGNDPEAFPKVRAWQEALLMGLQEEVGLEPLPKGDRSPHLVLVFSTEALVGALDAFPPHYAFVGPAFGTRPAVVDFPWDALRPEPKVLVSLGTVNAEQGARFYRAVVEGLGDQPCQVILVAPEALVGPLPDNFIRRDYVPQVALLEHVDVVVSHGGHNTVCESIAHGVPLVVTPIKHDQPVIARQVVTAGVGLRLRFGRIRGADLRQAVHQLLHEPAFREAAHRVADSFRRAGGAERAAEHLEALL
jgi:MGT family glycosyltransferase